MNGAEWKPRRHLSSDCKPSEPHICKVLLQLRYMQAVLKLVLLDGAVA